MKIFSRSDINDLIISIYKTSANSSINEYKEAVFKQLKHHIRFDSGLWFTGSSLSVDIHPSGIFIADQPMEMLLNFMSVKETDPLLIPLQLNPGSALGIEDVMNIEEWRHSDNYLKHCKLFLIEQVISVLILEPDTSLYHVISLYRKGIKDSFDMCDKKALEEVFPHMIEGRKFNLNMRIEESHLSTERTLICEASNNTLAGFNDGEYSIGNGELLRPSGRISINPVREKEFYIRYKEADLTPREVTIAHLASSGLSNKEIAERTSLSSYTVRNHLHNIAKKTGIQNRAHLSSILSKSTTKPADRSSNDL